MKEYDLISIGTGSAMTVVEAMIQENPKLRVAVIDKDEPGGICLTRGCIPSKLLLYPAELVRTVEKARMFGIDSEIKKIDFKSVMERMRNIIHGDIDKVRQGLSHSKNVDYYPEAAEFVAPYTLKVGDETITAKMIVLGTGSKPAVPPIKGIEETGYLTSDTILNITELPKSIIIVGGGYIAAEYSHFLSSMGAQVTIIGRNPQFIPEEEPEVSALAQRELGKHVTIYVNHEVRETKVTPEGKKRVVAVNRETGKKLEVTADELLIATGRAPLSDLLHLFTYPEIAAVGLREKEAIEKYGADKLLIGFYRYEDTAKGEAIDAKDYFVKVIVERGTTKILGAHIIGPYASILIHEIIPLMYTSEQSAKPIRDSMHIHPALSEVVDRAFRSLLPPEHYHHLIEHHYKLLA